MFAELAMSQRWSAIFCATGLWGVNRSGARGLKESFLRISKGLENLLLPGFKLFFGKKLFSEEAFEYWKSAQRKSSSKMRKTRRIWWSRGFILCFPSIRNESFFLQVPKTTRFLEKDFFFFAWKTLLVEKTARLEKWPAVNLRDTFFPAHYELKHSDQADNNGPSSQIKEILYKKFSRVEFVQN